MNRHDRSRQRPASARKKLVLLTLSLLAACGRISDDRCEEKCNCEACSDRDRESCIVEIDAEEDIAEVYGCEDFVAAYYVCETTKYTCREGRYQLDDRECQRERSDRDQCIHDGSAVR